MILAPILSLAELIINPLLKRDETTLKRLASIEGKLIQVEVSDWYFNYNILPHRSGIQLISNTQGQTPNCKISGKLLNLFQVFCNQGSSVTVFKQNINIEGDSELAEKLHEIMQNLDIDWEDIGTKILGDKIGMQLVNKVNGFKSTAQDMCKVFRDNAIDYLQVESNHLPSKRQIEEFYQNVSTLRDDVDRAEIRLQRLKLRTTR